ncbi:hypothetical protein ABVT39_012312 [Epinephelus coioides]
MAEIDSLSSYARGLSTKDLECYLNKLTLTNGVRLPDPCAINETQKSSRTLGQRRKRGKVHRNYTCSTKMATEEEMGEEAKVKSERRSFSSAVCKSAIEKMCDRNMSHGGKQQQSGKVKAVIYQYMGVKQVILPAYLSHTSQLISLDHFVDQTVMKYFQSEPDLTTPDQTWLSSVPG